MTILTILAVTVLSHHYLRFFQGEKAYEELPESLILECP